MKKHIPQFELGWKEEPFALIQDQAIDFDRIKREQDASVTAKAEQDRNHLDLFEK
jgi:hypothetical protein